jgi:chemotaxis protein CheD
MSRRGVLAVKNEGSSTAVEPSAPEQEAARCRVYLHPGQLHAAAEPTEVATVLGSCVSLCLWDPKAQIGGVNHYTLPLPPGGDPRSPRFGEPAIEILRERVLALGALGSRLQAKVCGGASTYGVAISSRSLGLQNVELARRLLASLGIPIMAEHVGGNRGRKLIFHTDTGIAWVKRL